MFSFSIFSVKVLGSVRDHNLVNESNSINVKICKVDVSWWYKEKILQFTMFK